MFAILYRIKWRGSGVQATDQMRGYPKTLLALVHAVFLWACSGSGTEPRDGGTRIHRVVFRNGNDTARIVVTVRDAQPWLKGGKPRYLYGDTLAPGEASDTIPFPTDSLYSITWSWHEPLRDPDLPMPQNTLVSTQIYRAYHSWDGPLVVFRFRERESGETPPIEFR